MIPVVVPTDDFVKGLKEISKKHKGIFADIAKLSAQLKKDPTIGTPLGQNLYKIRIAVSGTNKGKSGGARVITYVFLANAIIYLTDIYLKSEYDTIDANLLLECLKKQGLI